VPQKRLDQKSVIQAAAELADEQGLAGVSLATLAKKLGIRTPSLYNHMDGMSGLRSHLSLLGLKQLYEALTLATVGKSKDDAIRAMAAAYVAFARKHPGLYETTQCPAYWQEEDVHLVAQQVVNLFSQVLKGCGLSNDLSIHMIRVFRSLLHGFASIEQQGGFGIPLDLNESLQLLIDTFLAGIHSHCN
jgi:AcrR family transcriptional regulator